ncbi:FimV family protein [Thermomonas sp.]|uniref:type IV pilus assembly protein FimV n=1 Tax=Thermomonas sp. TaxID=1971895 RepID=UPI0039195DE9
MIRTLRTAVAAALLLAAGNAWALGLGQIQVKSKRNQPLLAEIPIVSTTPGELAALRARLASPDTFRRVGLAPPTGIASDLQFSLGSDSKGRPVIRVTTLRPVEQAELNFLIEVDWGAGRLVREYSALVDAPNTAGAVLPPDVQAPQTPAPAVVQRPSPMPGDTAPAAVPLPDKPVVPPAMAPAPAPAEPAAPSIAIAPLPATRPAYVPAPAPAASADPAEYGPVKRGESLSKIASGLGLRREFSLDQTMLALLQANPDAFLGDDVNRLRSGAVLRVPSREDVARIAPEEAAQVVRQQMRQWRQSRRAVRQPDAAPAVARAAAPAKPAASKPATAPAAASAAAKPTASPATAAPRQEARLQIVPPSGPGKATGNKSGTSAGGEGSMLQQELRQRDEDIAAKSAEISELKERLAALEKLKDEQQKLISLKDSELAAAQARLAEANRGAQAAVPAPAAAKAATQAAPAPQAGGSSMPWIWGGLGVVVLALGAWLLAGRRRPAPPVRRSLFDSEALAASMAAPVASATIADEVPHVDHDAAAADAPVDADAGMPTTDAAATPAPTVAGDERAVPAWHRTEVPAAEPAPAVTEATVPVIESTEPAVAGGDVDDLPAPADVPVQASAEQRFKLARAFLDVGDENSAQQLLLELLDDDDQAVSDEAARMLGKLVG